MNPYHNNPEEQINATLRRLAHTQPPMHLEQRLRTRLQEKTAQQKTRGSRFQDFFFGQRIVFASVAAAMACVAIVIGSVQHSHQHNFPEPGFRVPVPGSGLGAASSTHIAPQPIVAPEHAHARSEQKAENGRATVSRDAHKPKGVAVPESTEATKP